jgi:hypothetical protein
VMAKRDIFGELVEGVAAMKSHREGKLMLRSYKVVAAPLPKIAGTGIAVLAVNVLSWLGGV